MGIWTQKNSKGGKVDDNIQVLQFSPEKRHDTGKCIQFPRALEFLYLLGKRDVQLKGLARQGPEFSNEFCFASSRLPGGCWRHRSMCIVERR